VTGTWYVVNVEDALDSTVLGPGIRLRFTVSPDNRVLVEDRTDEQIVESAASKGLDVGYVAACCGISEHRLAEVRMVIRNKMFRERGSFPKHAVSMDPVLRIAAK